MRTARFTLLMLSFWCAIASQITVSQAAPHVYGTLMSDPKNAATNVGAGVTLATTSVRWERFEPQEGIVDTAYTAQVGARLKSFRDAGMQVILDLGMHYPPAWIWNVPNSRFVNQYGIAWDPTSPGQEATNGVFNALVREKQAAYVKRLFQELGTDFFAVRLGWEAYGELHYPFTFHKGKTNCYWAFDDLAQGRIPTNGTGVRLAEGISPCPVPGWTPGTPSPNHESAAKFLNWYYESLANYQDWQIVTTRKFFPGRLIILYPSFGIRPGDIDRAVATDLNGSSPAEKASPQYANGTIHGGQIQIGYDVARLISHIRDPQVLPYATNVGTRYSDDDSDDPIKWSPTHYITSLVASNSTKLQIFGENAGNGNAEAMQRSFTEMRKYGLIGLVWAFEGQLYKTDNAKYASINDYAALIREHP